MHQKVEDVKEQPPSEQKVLALQILMLVKLLTTLQRKIFSFLIGHSLPYHT
jgi:hypothetical protein